MCFFCWFRIRFFISFSNCDQSIARWNSCISAYRHLPLNDAETRENWEKTFLRVHFVPPKFPHIYHLACQTASSTNSSRFPLVINCHKVCIVICGLDSYYQTLSSRVENSKKNILWQHAGASRKNFFPKWVGRGRGRWFWKKIKIQGLMYSRFSLLTTTYLLLLTKYRDLKLKSTLPTYYSQKNKFLLEVKILSNLFIFQIDTVELWEAQSKNPGPLDYQISQGSTAFAEELQAQDLVFRMDAGRITNILAHPEEPSHVLNIKRGILSAFQVQFVDDHATLEEVRSSLCWFLQTSRAGIESD